MSEGGTWESFLREPTSRKKRGAKLNWRTVFQAEERACIHIEEEERGWIISI